MATHDVLHGIGVSAGTAAAPAAIVQPAPGVDTTEPGSVDAAADGARVREALAAVSTRLSERAANAPEETKAILKATAQLAGDRGLAKAVDKKLKKGLGVTQAVHDAVEDYAQMLRGLGGYMAERATDLYDVRDRVICELRGLPEPGVPAFDGPVVLVARDLAPAETATLNPETVLGIITEVGGPTSHTAILAAQLGIPAIVKAEGIMAVEEGTMLALDGGVGEVIVAPTDDEVDLLKERSRRRALALAGSTGEGATYDGYRVKLLANIGTVDDAIKSSKVDLEGSGLFRTEFLFLERSEAPTLEEQTDTYTKVLQAFGSRRVVVRTLDAGADKPLSFADLGAEENPALGVRGLRLCQVREDLIDTQLQALAAAHKATGADLWVMAPMVATADFLFLERSVAPKLEEQTVTYTRVLLGFGSRRAAPVDRGLRLHRHERPDPVHDGRRPSGRQPGVPPGSMAARGPRDDPPRLQRRSCDGQADWRVWRGGRRPAAGPGPHGPGCRLPVDGTVEGQVRARRPAHA